MSQTDPLPSEDKPHVQQYKHESVSARVPERVRAVYSTGQLILDSPKEFVIDFLQGLARPHQIVARVVMTPQTMSEFSAALQQNFDIYVRSFGQPAALPPPPDRRPSIEEIYQNFKLSDDLLSGTYANAVLIGHSPTEFAMDFITSFYPTSAVAARVIVPAQQAPRFLNTLKTSIQQYQTRHGKREGPPPSSEGKIT